MHADHAAAATGLSPAALSGSVAVAHDATSSTPCAKSCSPNLNHFT